MILIPFPEMKLLTETLALAMGAELRTLDWHHFPDGESLMTLPGDLDGALLLLASDASDFMTGEVVAVDGGHLVNTL